MTVLYKFDDFVPARLRTLSINILEFAENMNRELVTYNSNSFQK